VVGVVIVRIDPVRWTLARRMRCELKKLDAVDFLKAAENKAQWWA